jgi:GT2 family glycosyltransferase
LSVHVTVVIPTFNRPRQLEACLAALAASTYPADRFDVVVVDDGGSADLRSVIQARREASPDLSVRLERTDRGGPAAARNTGAALARGVLLAFTDDDCLPEAGWLDALVRCAAARPDHLIGGLTANQLTTNPFSAASQFLVSYLYEYSEGQRGNPRWAGFFTSNNLAVPADDFHRIGRFDTSFPLAAGEDREFCDRWLARGLPTALAPDARVHHAHHLGPASFWRQHWNYGRGAFHFNRARARRGAGPLQPQPFAFYADLVRYPFRHGSGPRAALEAALLAASQGANALGYFYERLRSRGAPDSA